MMMAPITAVELVGPRLAIHRPLPAFRRPLCRQLCLSSRRRPRSDVVGRLAYTTRERVGRQQHVRHLHLQSDAAALGPADAQFLASLLKRHPDVAPFRASQPPGAAAAAPIPMAVPVAVEQPAENGHSVERTQRLSRCMQNALLAIQRKDSRRLLVWVKTITKLPERELRDSVALLPNTTFTEFLRSLDPVDIAPHVDPTHGTRVSVGMWKVLNLQEVMDEYGVKRIMHQLLERMMLLAKAFQDSGRILITENYIHLIRAAGAVGDVEGTKSLWNQLNAYASATERNKGETEWKKGDSYNELLKARFQADPMTYGYDKTRISAFKARDLHNHANIRFWAAIRRLDRLQLHRRKESAFFGLDRNQAPYAEDLTRQLRKPGPISRFYSYVIKRGHQVTEELLCSFIVAFARAGSIRFINTHILADYFGIQVWKNDRSTELSVTATKRRTKPYKNPKRPKPPPPIKPTERLLHAVVTAYCSNGQLSMALGVVDYIHRVFRVDIPDKIWFELLEWAQVLRAKNIQTSWKMAGWLSQIPEPFAVLRIWQTMTSPPYSVRPGFDQYVILVRHLISRNAHGHEYILDAMGKLRGWYDEQCVAYERAAFAYTRVLRDGVDAAAAFNAFQQARFRKSYMWFHLSETCHQYLQNYRPSRMDSHVAVQVEHIPRFVRDNCHFLPEVINYRLESGYVSLRDPAQIRVQSTTRNFRMEVPMPFMRQKMQPIRSRVRFRHHRHSLAGFKNTKLDPLPLLLAEEGDFRR